MKIVDLSDPSDTPCVDFGSSCTKSLELLGDMIEYVINNLLNFFFLRIFFSFFLFKKYNNKILL